MKDKTELPEGDNPTDLEVGTTANSEADATANQVQVDADGFAWFEPTQASGSLPGHPRVTTTRR